MASLKNSVKFGQRIHKERGQLSHRKHLGLLEKHKDYVLRARDFHRKEKQIKLLRKKASERNPDEFYFNMVNAKTKNGVHELSNSKDYTHEQIKLMKTQDLSYITMRKSVEAKKIERMQANLHLLDTVDQQPRQHLFFVDTNTEVKTFDAAKHLNTVSDLLPRCHNRPTIETLRQKSFVPNNGSMKICEREKKKAYGELAQRMDRNQQLEKVRQEMELKKKLMGKGSTKKSISKTTGKAVYKWRKQRKK